MSKLDIINAEIARRENATVDLRKGNEDLILATEQFNKLDEMYRSDEKASRDLLECYYKENRHYSDSWPIVYSFAQTERYPFYGGPSDNQCNAYFPITQAQNGSVTGIEPFDLPVNYNGTNIGSGNDGTSHNRVRAYGATIEPTLRATALAAVAAFPDISEETGSGSCSGGSSTGSETSEAQCLAVLPDAGTWTPPGYDPGSTATEKLRAALDPWRAEIVLLMADLCMDDGTEEDFWQNILDNIDDIDAAIQVDVEYSDNTQDFTPGSDEDIARDYLIAETANINTHVTERSAFLQGEADTEEKVFFGVIKLRLHQANGSFAKKKAVKGQKATNDSLIADNDASLKSLNLLKVKNS